MDHLVIRGRPVAYLLVVAQQFVHLAILEGLTRAGERGACVPV
jgi:hypothetical protein